MYVPLQNYEDCSLCVVYRGCYIAMLPSQMSHFSTHKILESTNSSNFALPTYSNAYATDLVNVE